jgi:hypothetical protein
MADVFDRNGKEAAIIKVLMREFNRARLALLGLIPGLEPWATDVPPEFWGEHTAKLTGAISPLLSGTYLSQASTMLEEFEFLGVEWGLVNEAAVDWAKDYTYNLVGELNVTSRRYLGKELEMLNDITRKLQVSLQEYFQTPSNIGELSERLAGTFGPQRARTIAVTETTRAASEGEQEVARQLAAQGIKMQPIWITANDEIVRQCPICWPRHGRKIGVEIPNEYPPAHPNCRCGVIYDFIEREE